MHTMVRVHISPVGIEGERCPEGPVSRIEAPVEGRTPWADTWSPEVGIDTWAVDVDRLYHVVRTVHIDISHHLHTSLTLIIALHIYGSDILIEVFTDDSLDGNHADIVISELYYAEVVDIAILVEIEIGNVLVGIIEQTLEILKIFCIRKYSCYSFKIKVITDIGTGGFNGRHILRLESKGAQHDA